MTIEVVNKISVDICEIILFQKIRTLLKKIKSFSKKNKSFFEKITGFFKSVLAFLPLPGILLYFVEICTLFASKKTRTPYFTSSWNSLKKKFI